MTEPDPVRQKLLTSAKHGLQAMIREHAISHFRRVETMVARFDGLSDDQADEFFERMISDAEPGTEPVLTALVRDIKAARSAKPS